MFSYLSEMLKSYKYTEKIGALEFCSSMSRIDKQNCCIEKWIFFKSMITFQSDKSYFLSKFLLLEFKYCRVNFKASSCKKLLVLRSNQEEFCVGTVAGMFTIFILVISD